MEHVFIALGFHKNGKPRGWLRRLLLHHNKTPRSIFRRIVIKKNGAVRPRFVGWVQQRSAIPAPGFAQHYDLSTVVASQAQTSAAAGAPVEASAAPMEARGPNLEDIAVAAVLHGPPSLEETARDWRHGRTPDRTLDAVEIEKRLGAARISHGPFVLCLSHDNYATNTGGLQYCVRREETHFTDLGVDYLNLHPFQALPRLAHIDEDPDPFVEMVLNGATLGCARMSSVIHAIGRMAARGDSFYVVAHHLLGFHPEQVGDLVAAALSPRLLFWLHDYFSICPGYTLQRNNQSYCGAPSMDSNACNLCLYGAERPAHLDRLRKLFESVDVDVVSPSEFTLSFWKQHSALPVRSTCISPHVALDWLPRLYPVRDDPPEAVTVGYLGYHIPHKGWPVFERLAKALEADSGFRFVSLGADAPSDRSIGWTEVVSKRDNEDAMAGALAASKVDLVIHWPNWPETFSFTTYESLIGGAFVLTNPISGNIAATVERTGLGAVLADEQALLDFFSSGAARKLADEARLRRSRYSATSRCSGMSSTLLSLRRLREPFDAAPLLTESA
jgi:glycosyltransferase involved in cell wall biosynthesis